MPLVYSLQGDARGGNLHPQVGGVLLTTADLLALALPIDYGTVASGAAGAGGCPVGVGVDFQIQARTPTLPLISSPLILSSLYTLTRLVPQQTDDQVQPLDLAPCVLVVEISFRSVGLQASMPSVSSRPSRLRLDISRS